MPRASDSFTYSNGELGATSGGNWVKDGTAAQLDIVSNAVRAHFSSDSPNVSHYNISPGVNQDSQVRIATFTGTSASYLMAIICIGTSASSPNRYRFQACRNDPYYGGKTSLITKIVSASETTLASEAATTWAANDTIKAEIIGTTLKFYRNGSATALLSITDSALSGGKVGIEIYTEESSLGNAIMDDWAGGDPVWIFEPSQSQMESGGYVGRKYV